MARTYRAGDSVEDFCRACKMDRMHTVIASDSEGRPLRVVCGYCDSEHNFRGGPRIGTDDRSAPPAAARAPRPARTERDNDVLPLVSERERGGPAMTSNTQLQEKTWPIETFFHKVVMLRNRLRTLEQQLNAAELPEDLKVKLQGYITGCYGSLTSFNVLFAEEDDQFKGSGGE